MKKNSTQRVLVGVLTGMVLLAGVVWLLTRTLGNTPQYLFAGKPIQQWRKQLYGRDTGASNEAVTVVNSQVIPQLTNIMFHDTNDSSLRIALVDTLNQLPGVCIYFTPAGARRVNAVQDIGDLGPAARAAVPVLIQALKGKNAMVREPAIQALGKIHSDPEVVIPLLIGYLGDDGVNDEAAMALASYGSLAKAAVQKIIPLLHASDDDAQRAAAEALKKIDPEAYTSATRTSNQVTDTNSPPVETGGMGVLKPK